MLVSPCKVSPPVLRFNPAKVDVAVVLAFVTERNPLNVEVEFVPSTFRNPCRVEVPPVKAWMVEVEVRPTYRASRAAIPLPIKSPVKVEVPKERDGAVTERNPAKVEVAPRLVTERLVRVVVPAERVEDKVVAPALDKEPKLADCEKRLVELAVPAKLVVEVALVVVLLSPVKLARVEEALETKPLLKYQERFVVSVVLAV